MGFKKRGGRKEFLNPRPLTPEALTLIIRPRPLGSLDRFTYSVVQKLFWSSSQVLVYVLPSFINETEFSKLTLVISSFFQKNIFTNLISNFKIFNYTEEHVFSEYSESYQIKFSGRSLYHRFKLYKKKPQFPVFGTH